MQKDVILTPEGLEKLKKEIEHLSTDKRREVAERIKEAREFGDISENSEYDDAKNEQAMLEAQIAQLEDKLRSAQVIDASRARHGRRAGRLAGHVKDEKGKAFKYTIVGSTEADPSEQAALQRVAGRQGARRPQARRHGEGAARPRASASSRSPRSTSRSGSAPGPRPGDVTSRRRDAAEPPSCSPTRRRKLERAARGRDRPVPARVPGRAAIAAVKAPHEELAPRGGDRARAPRRRPPRRAARAGQGGVPRPRRPLGAHAAARARRRARRRSVGRGCCRSTSATCSAPTARCSARAAASCRCALDDFTCWPSRCARRRRSTTACPTSRPASASASST